MRLFVFITLMIASLAYGLLPARAGVDSNVAAPMVTMENMHHAGHHSMDMAKMLSSDDGCQNDDGTPHGCFCPACLAIVPAPDLVRDKPMIPERPLALVARTLVSLPLAPAEPPPRA
ncbi:MAG: hypothetical protein LCH47_15220 [Proteobacteria bacterium]|nr:hypothetical protein [Pseudomonadota bacterium]